MANYLPYKIENNPVYVYASNSGTSKIINALNVGTSVKVAYIEDGWMKLLNTGWIMSSNNVVLDEDKVNANTTNAILAGIKESKKSKNRIMLAKTVSGGQEDQDTKQTETEEDKEAAAKKTAEMADNILSWFDQDAGEGGTGSDFTSASARIGYFNINGMRGVFGMPYQFDWTTDMRVKTTSGGSAEYTSSSNMDNNSLFGRMYLEKIAARSPIAIFQAGNPKFMDEFSSDKKDGVLSAIEEKIKGTDNEESLSTKINNVANNSGKYYSFNGDPTAYFNAVNNICRGMASLLNLGSYKPPGCDKSLGDYDWGNASISFNKGEYIGAVAFYVNSEAQVNESFNTGTRQSSLVSTLNQISDMAAEAQFLMGSLGASGNLNKKLKDVGVKKDQDEVAKKKETKPSTSATGLIGSLMNNIDTLMSGGKMIFPEIWSDSQFSKSYDVTLKFDSPDCDNLSIYLNILVPLAHILGLIMPRKAGDNAYVSPFIVRAFYKSMFHIDMGIITSCNIIKGDVQAWTQSGLPTQITVQLTIKDLYNVLSMSAGGSSAVDDLIGNPAELDYIGNLCGINMGYPDFRRTLKLFWYIKGNIANNAIAEVENQVIKKITASIANIYNQWYRI